jgi:hypothetical protein
MSEDAMHPVSPGCELYAEDLAELALGTLAGRQRVAVLQHVDSCLRCAEEVETLSHALDSLVQIAPDVEPPLGFEVRLFERLGLAAPQPVRRRGPRRVPVPTRRARNAFLAAAAAIVAVAGFAVGHLIETPAPAPTQSAAITGVLQSGNGQTMGQVVVTSTRPAWLYMYVEGDSHAQQVRCELRLADGKFDVVGTFWTERGYGTWSSALTVPASQVAGARLVSMSGATLATANLAT